MAPAVHSTRAMTNFQTIPTTALDTVNGGKKKKSAPAPLGPTMQGALTKGGFQFSVAV